MIFKLRQQQNLHKRTPQNRTPNFRSRTFIINFMYQKQKKSPSARGRAVLGFTRWAIRSLNETENRTSHRMQCIITGRSRGLLQRLNVARTKVKCFMSTSIFPGVKKSSW